MVVPSPPFFRGPGQRLEPQIEPLGKDALRRAALDARKAFVRSLSDGERTLAEQGLAEHLTSLCATAKVVGGYAPLGSEISPQLAIEEARAIGALVKQGWRPKRTIVYAAWDGEEQGLLGSTEWVEQHAAELERHAVVGGPLR